MTDRNGGPRCGYARKIQGAQRGNAPTFFVQRWKAALVLGAIALIVCIWTGAVWAQAEKKIEAAVFVWEECGHGEA